MNWNSDISFMLLFFLMLLIFGFRCFGKQCYVRYRSKTILINKTKKIKTYSQESLLQILKSNNIDIKTQCNGGGTCGLCKCRIINPLEEVTEIEKSQLTNQEIQNGIRLSCQIKVNYNIEIEIF